MTSSLIQNPHLEGESFFWPGGSTGVVLTHGFKATTAEVRLLARFLHGKGCTVAGALLPGHRTTPDDMNRRKWREWAGAVEQTYQQVAAQCSRVWLGGESMGAVLSLYIASQPIAREAAGLLLYAPALMLPNRMAWLPKLLGPFIPYVKPKLGRAPTLADENWQGYTVNPVRAAAQLYDLQDKTRPRLPQVRQPLLVVQGRLDTTIDPRSGEVILSESASAIKELHWFERSTHCVILDTEWPQIAELTWQFIERVSK